MALRIGKDLDLHVARRDHGALQDQFVGAERGRGLGARAGQRDGQRRRLAHQPHAAPAAARRGLHHQREADRAGLGQQRGVVLGRALVARHARHVGGQHQALGLGLVAHGADRPGGRAHEDQARRRDGLGKGRVLGQEAVAGVDGVGAAGAGGLDDGGDVQVRLARRGGADADRAVRGRYMRAVAVGLGVDGHGGQPEAARGAHDAHRDLAAVGDEQRMEGSAGCRHGGIL
ncbi:hypothetical protein D9M68_559380 [compost metagenome]